MLDSTCTSVHPLLSPPLTTPSFSTVSICLGHEPGTFSAQVQPHHISLLVIPTLYLSGLLAASPSIFRTYLSQAQDKPGTLLGTGETEVSEQDKVRAPCSYEPQTRDVLERLTGKASSPSLSLVVLHCIWSDWSPHLTLRSRLGAGRPRGKDQLSPFECGIVDFLIHPGRSRLSSGLSPGTDDKTEALGGRSETKEPM